MTDNEIIKTLECLCGGGNSCIECAYHKKYRFNECRKQVAKDALDLIKRQQVESEKLQKNQDDIDNFARDICKERLLKGKAIANFDDLQEYIRKEKSKVDAIQCTIDDDVSINEVYDNYDVIDKQGDIWTLRKKTNEET